MSRPTVFDQKEWFCCLCIVASREPIGTNELWRLHEEHIRPGISFENFCGRIRTFTKANILKKEVMRKLHPFPLCTISYEEMLEYFLETQLQEGNKDKLEGWMQRWGPEAKKYMIELTRKYTEQYMVQTGSALTNKTVTYSDIAMTFNSFMCEIKDGLVLRELTNKKMLNFSEDHLKIQIHIKNDGYDFPLGEMNEK